MGHYCGIGSGRRVEIYRDYIMRVVSAVVAIAVGLLVLLGYFLPMAIPVQTILLEWAVIFVAVAAVVGVINLATVHADKVRRRAKGGIYSAMLVMGLIVVAGLGLAFKPQNSFMQAIFLNGIIIPVEASLLALLTVTLLYTAIRLLRRRADAMSITFIVTASLIFFASATLPFGDMPILGTLIRPWVSQVLALGGVRGILIGVSLGTLLTGLRVLFGIDRPYGGK